jgi:hypothetical protein
MVVVIVAVEIVVGGGLRVAGGLGEASSYLWGASEVCTSSRGGDRRVELELHRISKASYLTMAVRVIVVGGLSGGVGWNM